MRIRRNTARVLPVDRDGRVLLLLGQNPLRRADIYWLSVGGAPERGETLPETAVRELWEETRMRVDPARLRGPLGTSAIEYSSFGLLPMAQRQTYFAVAVDDTAVSFAGQGWLERSTLRGHEWLTDAELVAKGQKLSDPELPQMMRAALAAVRDAGQPG